MPFSNANVVGFMEQFGNGVLLFVIIVLGLQTIVQVVEFAGVRIPWITGIREDRERARFGGYVEELLANDPPRLARLIEGFFVSEHDFIRKYREVSVELVLSQLGLTQQRFSSLRPEILRLISAPAMTAEQREASLQDICASALVRINTKELKEPIYREVEVYLDFVDVMFDPQMGSYLGDLLAQDIRSRLAPEQLEQMVLVAPTKGNVLLAYYAGQKLGRPVVFARPSPRLRRHQYWDGNLPPGAPAAIIHDVLVSGDQLIETHRSLRNAGSPVVGVFGLVDRRPAAARERMTTSGLPAYAITKVDLGQVGKPRG